MGGWLSKSFDPVSDIPDLTGRVIIVTGANTGLGYQTVKHLSRKGAKVYLCARNESKATGAMAQLEAEGLGPGNGEVKWLNLDLLDPRKAKAAAQEFLSQETRLDILINNAAGTFPGSGKTDDGIQQTMIVNHLSPYVFTEALIPLMIETAKLENTDVRIINVSSGAHSFGGDKGIRFRNKEDFNQEFKDTNLPFISKYGYSKLAALLYTNALQQRFDEQNIPIICISPHPGGARTDGALGLTPAFPLLLRPIFLLLTAVTFTTPEVGAHNQVFAAASPTVREKVDLYKGAYVSPVGKITKPSKNGQNDELTTELMDGTVEILKEIEVL